MKLNGLKFNFLGDSITEGVGTSGNDKRYFEIIKRIYNLSEVNGYGVAGTRMAKQIVPSEIPSYDQFFSSRVDSMENADGIVVFGGVNDFGSGDAPIGTFSDKTTDTFYGACHDLYSKLIEKYYGKPIVIMTPLHFIDENILKTKHGVEVTLKTYVDIIREVAEFYSLPVCDLFKNSGIQPSIDVVRKTFMPDGLHPNDEGHKKIAERLGNFLSNL